MASNRRSRIGLINPQRQLRIAFYSMGGGITALMLFCIYLLMSLENSFQNMLANAQVPTEVSDSLLDQVGSAQLQVSFAGLLLLACAVFIGIKVTHRVYGPVVQIRKHIANLIAGDYSSRVQLRDHDHFTELAEELNLLAEKLAAPTAVHRDSV